MREIGPLWGAPPRTPAADKLEVLVTLVDAYESRHHPIDLADIIGSRARISEVFNRRRPLTIAMIAKLRDRLGISADVLIGPQRRAA